MSHDLAATSTDQEPRMDHYELLDTIGHGSFAEVSLARHILTGAEVAIKAIRKRGSSRLLGEAHCMKVLNHPNIVKLFEVIDTESTLFLVMEHVTGGNLYDYLEDRGRLTENEARGFFRQLVSAVEYCHQKGIVHRDLKPQNMLLDAELNVRLADFGISKEFTGRKLRTFCGSLPYVAPELYLGGQYDAPKVDVWSLGVLLYTMVTGTQPFEGDDFRELRKRILGGRYYVPSFLTTECKQFLNRLLIVNPRDRATLKELMKDPWLHLGQEELRPYTEPPCDNMDPWVTQVMMKMGFERDQIEESVARRRYDKLMATYLILTTTKPEVKVCTIKVRPFPSSDSSSLRPSPALQVQPSGQGAKDTGSPTASLQSKTSTPQPSPESRTTPPQPSPESKASTPQPCPESSTYTPQPSPESRATPPQSILGPRTTPRQPNPGSRASTPLPYPESRTSTPQPSLASRTSSPQPRWGSKTSYPQPSPGLKTRTPQPCLGSKTQTSHPSPGSRTQTPQPSHESRTQTPQPSLWSKTRTPQTSPELKTRSLHPSPKSRTRTPQPCPESNIRIPQLSPESRTRTLQTSQESRTASHSSAPQRSPWGTPSALSSSSHSSSTGAPEGTHMENSLHSGKPEEVTPASSLGHSQGCQGVARRFLTRILSCLCCWPSAKKKHIKKNKIKPI